MLSEETIMKPRCDPASDHSVYLENAEACHDTAVKIIEQLGPAIEMRHRIGEAMTTPEGRKTIPAMEKGLSEAATSVLDTYSREEENCEKTDNTQSCIYAEQFRSFVKFFGPVVPEAAGSERNPVSIKMAPLKSGSIVVPLEPKSSGYEVILDTGANVTMLSVGTANTFKEGIRVLSRSRYGQNTPFVSIKDMSFDLGGIKFQPTLGLVSAAVDFLEGSDERHTLVAVLGADFLFHRSWLVNYDRSDLVLNKDVEKEISGDNGWSQIPVFPTPYGVFYDMGIDVHINGKSFRLQFDTGTNSTSLLEQCPLTKAKDSKGSFSVSLEGLRKEMELEDVPVKFGKYKSVENVSVFPKDSINAGMLHQAGFCGLFGTDVLDGYNYMYDPKTLSLYIKPRDEKNIPSLRRAGFVPKRTILEGGQRAFIVSAIGPGTPAEKAGLKPGDMIVEFNGMKSGLTSMSELLETSYSTQPEIPVTIIRDGKIEKLTLQFKK